MQVSTLEDRHLGQSFFLGLESSCDETAAAIVSTSVGENAQIISSIVFDQTMLHKNFGGIVPEIAARAHAERMDICVSQALQEAAISLNDIKAIAVTAGPGLIGGVLSGVMCAKGLALGSGKPLIGVNHLAGHALTPRLTDRVKYPYLMLLISGGHCQFLLVRSAISFDRLGGTIDDAPGEAFDKTARLLGLPQPGGPFVEKEGALGNPNRFHFPRPLLDRTGCDLSFSGLKTALLRKRNELVDEQGGLYEKDRADFCASFEAAVCDVLVEKSRRALAKYLELRPNTPVFCVAGGVAANQRIRTKLEHAANQFGVHFFAPPLSLCTDNAAMIAYAGSELYALGERDDLDLIAKPRWPLDTRKPALLGGGKKGAKA
ncbi:MAG: tRNA (adenosine(37)-N6)-threonylcarbamoyltransferase complex transferase subunit TsaD [Rhodobacteraceae bacterium]|nr:tRNA (adenosine(37)-N6)-threonylcarbamoyltransferase complex transferase subunit TsaD [Paracoccaceae bacterium]